MIIIMFQQVIKLPIQYYGKFLSFRDSWNLQNSMKTKSKNFGTNPLTNHDSLPDYNEKNSTKLSTKFT